MGFIADNNAACKEYFSESSGDNPRATLQKDLAKVPHLPLSWLIQGHHSWPPSDELLLQPSSPISEYIWAACTTEIVLHLLQKGLLTCLWFHKSKVTSSSQPMLQSAVIFFFKRLFDRSWAKYRSFSMS